MMESTRTKPGPDQRETDQASRFTQNNSNQPNGRPGGSAPPGTSPNRRSSWLRWLIFPHNVNYHVEHHLYASVPQYNLPRLHAEMKRHGILDGAEVMPFGQTLAKIFAEKMVTVGNFRAV